MKIALVLPNFPPEFLGGTERVGLALARALRDAGDDVLVCAGSDRITADAELEDERLDGLPVVRLPRRPDEPYDLRIPRPRLRDALAARLGRFAPDAVHVHHWIGASDELVATCKALGSRVVVTFHDLWVTCPRFFRERPDGGPCPTAAGRDECIACIAPDVGFDETVRRDRLRERDARVRAEVETADVLTAPSRSAAEAVRTHLPTGRAIEVVPHGLLEAVAETRDPVGGGPGHGIGPVRIGTFGNLVRSKGVLLLVDAAAGLAGVELHLFGRFLDPTFESEVCERAAARNVALVRHGAYGPDDPHPALALDLAVFPSLCAETYGLVVDEALARGVPVVVSDRGALPERVGPHGEVVAVDRVEPLGAALRRALVPGRLAELGRGLPTRPPTIADAAARYRRFYRAEA